MRIEIHSLHVPRLKHHSPMPISPNGYEAIMFDLDGTLRHLPRSPVDLFFEFSAHLGLTFDAEAPLRLQRWQHNYWADKERVDADRALGEAEFWLEMLRKELRFLGVTEMVDSCASEINERFIYVFQNTQGILPTDGAHTLSKLRELGYTIGLVSNRPEPLHEQVAELELDSVFHFTLSAGEANSWKPDGEIFHQALEMAGTQAHTAVYVGDNYYADVVGSRDAGLTPLLFDPQNVFPYADCDRIASIGEILTWLERSA